MDKGRFLIETHLRTGRPIAELAAAHGVSRGWLYKLLARYRREGPEGLEPRSRRPQDLTDPDRRPLRGRGRAPSERSSPSVASTPGPRPSTSTCRRPGRNVPSVSTIQRVLVARGFVTPEPHKRPKSSWTRFVAEFPNECWQADVTHVEVAERVVYEVLNVIDDHSRLCVASHVFVSTRSPDVVRTLHKAAESWGYPQRLLTDNGRIFTTPMGIGGGRHGDRAALLGHRHETRQALSPSDPGKGGALPPDREEVRGGAGPGADQEATAGSAQPLRQLLQRRATPPRHRPAHPPRGLARPGEGETFLRPARSQRWRSLRPPLRSSGSEEGLAFSLAA